MTSFRSIFSFCVRSFQSNFIVLVIGVTTLFWSTFIENSRIIFEKSIGTDQWIIALESGRKELQIQPVISMTSFHRLDPPCRQGREATIPTELNFDNSKQYNFFDRSYVSQRHISPKIHRSTTKSLFIVSFPKYPKSVSKTGSRRRPLSMANAS